MDAVDGGLEAGVVEWLFGEVLLDARFKPADQRSSTIRPVIWRSVAELMAGYVVVDSMLRRTDGKPVR